MAWNPEAWRALGEKTGGASERQSLASVKIFVSLISDMYIDLSHADLCHCFYDFQT